MCADTTTSPMRRTQDSVTHVPSLHPVIFLSLNGRGLTSLPEWKRGVPRYGVRVNPAGRGYSGLPPTHTNDPRRGGFQTRLGWRKMATPAGRPLRHSVAPTSSFPRRACPVPRYGAGIHALTPRGKTSIANPGTTNAVNVARGLVPRYGVPPTGNPSD